MNQLPSSRWSRGVNRFPLRLQVCPGNLQADRVAQALTGGGFRTIKGFGNLIPFARGTEKHPRQEPEASALLRVPPHYLPFPFLVPKPAPRALPGLLSGQTPRWAAVPGPSVRPRPCHPSGAVHPSLWTHRSWTPGASL